MTAWQQRSTARWEGAVRPCCPERRGLHVPSASQPSQGASQGARPSERVAPPTRRYRRLLSKLVRSRLVCRSTSTPRRLATS